MADTSMHTAQDDGAPRDDETAATASSAGPAATEKDDEVAAAKAERAQMLARLADPALVESALAKDGTEQLSVDERYTLCRDVGEECIQEEELYTLLQSAFADDAKRGPPVCYDGFEPSGRMHIAQGVMKALNVNKLTRAGCTFKFW